MDSGSDRDRQDDNEIENLMETVNNEEPMEEEVPLILRHDFRDMFPIISNMLDIKSFTKLSNASREMYNRCKTDRGIRIEIKENTIILRPDENGDPIILFNSANVRAGKIDSYLSMLRTTPCRLTLKSLIFTSEFDGERLPDADSLLFMDNYLKEIGVYSIKRFIITGFTGWRVLPKFLEKYKVQNLKTLGNHSDDLLRSLLQLNLKSFTHHSAINAKAILDVDSTIKKLEFGRVRGCDKNTFLQMLWKIQTGPLRKLNMLSPDVDLTNYQILPFDYDGPLPEQRPLFFRRNIVYRIRIYWILHWQGGVTKCSTIIDRDEDKKFIKMDIVKCDPSDYPPILKPKEEVFKQLTAMEDEIVCSFVHFKSFFDGIPVIDSDFSSSFPEERPLVCRKEEGRLWLLDEDDTTVKCYKWTEGIANVSSYDMKREKIQGVLLPRSCHRAMMKYFFHRMIREVDNGYPSCDNLAMFLSWFEDFKTLPYDFHEAVPEERPLVFARSKRTKYGYQKEIRTVLMEDGSVKECSWNGHVAHMRSLENRPHRLPSILISCEILKKIILTAPFRDGQMLSPRVRPPKRFEYQIDLEMFRSAFDDLNPLPYDYDGPLPEDRPVIYEKTVKLRDNELTELRYISKDYFVTKAVWSKGILTFINCHNGEMPVAAKKALIKNYLKGTWTRRALNIREFYLDAAVFSSCVNELQTLSHNFRGPLPAERPLFFTKTDVKHECNGEEKSCGCSGKIVRIWSICEDDSTLYCSWGENEEDLVIFPHTLDAALVPPVLKTKQYFKYLVEREWSPDVKPFTRSIKFYGERNVFINYFNSKRFARIPRDHFGSLPSERPLVAAGRNSRWMIREDSKVIECSWNTSHVDIYLSYTSRIPTRLSALRQRFFNSVYFHDMINLDPL